MVTPGSTSAMTPKTMASTPLSAIAHQFRASASLIFESAPDMKENSECPV
jgi:hypothetical protein